MNIVFDLDETLVSTIPRYFVKSKYCKKYKNFIFDKNYRVFIRPYVIEFLNYLLENNFKIYIFSRGETNYVNEVARFIEENINGKFTKIYSLPDCLPYWTPSEITYLKPLKKYFNDSDNVILIDDNPENETYNEGNFLLCQEFNLAKKVKNEYLYFSKLLKQIKENKNIFLNYI
jgi:TFIIF-interacting CTD phosphatase-like protein